eukprot:3743263-Rhodomonas_salina.1
MPGTHLSRMLLPGAAERGYETFLFKVGPNCTRVPVSPQPDPYHCTSSVILDCTRGGALYQSYQHTDTLLKPWKLSQ